MIGINKSEAGTYTLDRWVSVCLSSCLFPHGIFVQHYKQENDGDPLEVNENKKHPAIQDIIKR